MGQKAWILAANPARAAIGRKTELKDDFSTVRFQPPDLPDFALAWARERIVR
jgi:hypothetical protein